MVAGTFEELAVAGESTRLYSCGRDRVSAGVVIFHPWWGLNDDVIAYADRLAGSGFAVLAPDLVRGRTASTIEQAERLAREKEDGHADAAALAAIDRLAGPGRGARIGAVGFSMGAAWAMWCAAQRDAVAASVIYYGTIAGPSLEQAIVPVLGHFAASDPYEPDQEVLAFERRLRDAGREALIHRYPGTGHWFAEPSRKAWRSQAAELAFDRTVAFLWQHLQPRP